MSIKIREFQKNDVAQMIAVWNEIIEEGNAFPQENKLDEETGYAFFREQTYCAVAAVADTILGLYTLHPNNIGRCGHISNASYAVGSMSRGMHIGEKLVKDSLAQAAAHGFKIMQFNAVVQTNIHAIHLYERLGFIRLGNIPGGFRMKDGHYETMSLYYIALGEPEIHR